MIKYQQGGSTSSAQQQEQLAQLFQMAARNAKVNPEQLVQKVQELSGDQQAVAQFMQGLQLCAQGDPQGIQFIQSLFKPAYRQGGKIHDFVCKHKKGGVTGCGCGQEGLKLPNFQYLGSYASQDANNPNKFNIMTNAWNLFDQKLAVPTKEGAFRMGLEAGAAYDNGEKVYSPSAWQNLRTFYEDTLPNANRVELPEDKKPKLAGMESGGKVKKHQQTNGKGNGTIGDQFKYLTDYRGDIVGRVFPNGLAEDMNGQPRTPSGIFDMQGNYLPNGMTGSRGPWYIVGDLGGINYHTPEGQETMLHGRDSTNASNTIKLQAKKNYPKYPSK